ncbi:MAG: hypothetical protein EOP29_22615 [Rhodococcus sp. (in: high G+C Gram-positive bacteria)]|nr:MAG: hypothetical protein EOP29_22615 [Rhodococcus sp. (in: high G+C Gram-positive bacteria)]
MTVPAAELAIRAPSSEPDEAVADTVVEAEVVDEKPVATVEADDPIAADAESEEPLEAEIVAPPPAQDDASSTAEDGPAR